MRERGVTVVFALVVLLLTTMAYGLKLSPLLAALTFGIVARERRVHLTNAQRDFGTGVTCCRCSCSSTSPRCSTGPMWQGRWCWAWC
jgi:hypothetical protein